MTSDQYQELVEFLAGQFTRVEERFTGVDERLTHVEIFEEQNRDLIRTVAEGVGNVDRKVDRLREEMLERFADQRHLIESSYRDLDDRVTRLESERGAEA